MSVSLTYATPTNLQLPRQPPQGIPPELMGVFTEVYNVLNNLASALTKDCGAGSRNPAQWDALAGSATTILANNMSRLYVRAGEDLSYGDIISLFDAAGVLVARKANATDSSKPADGFCSVPQGIVTGVAGEVILSHGVLPASGLTIAQRYFLSTVDGFMTPVPPTAAGNIEQYLGVAISSTALYFNSSYWIQH